MTGSAVQLGASQLLAVTRAALKVEQFYSVDGSGKDEHKDIHTGRGCSWPLHF